MNKKGIKIEPKPFISSVPIEKLLAFDPKNPATFTDIPFVNAVMEAFYAVKPVNRITLGQYLNIPPVKLAHTLDVLTGITFAELHEAWLLQQHEKLLRLHPDWTTDQIAKELGYFNGSSVWRLLHRGARKKLYAYNKRMGNTGHYG